jgi:ATP-dependent protease ClpP protease subunit
MSIVEDIKSYSPVGYEGPSVSPIILYIYDDIGPEVDYVDFVHTLRYAPAGQDITIHINSPGGNLNSCLSIINAIAASEANINTVVDGEAASAAAMIWLAGHTKLIASKHTMVMLHGASVGYNPSKTADIVNSTQATNKVVEALLDDLTSDILTEVERNDIRKGMDIYLTGADIIDRLSLAEDQEE